MLKEIYQYFTTPTNSYVRKLGYLSSSIALEARFSRCSEQWLPHYEQCKKAILQATALAVKKNTIVIIGAGSLKDIPLQNITKQFKTVILIDLVFLKQAKKTAKLYDNVILLEIDVSNCLKELLLVKTASELINFLNANPPDITQIIPINLNLKIDCIVSLNLATQLPLIPISFLIKKFNTPPQQLNELAQLLITQHLNILNNFAGVSCLIIDREICEFNIKGEQIECFDPAWGVDLPKQNECWDWQAVPLQESTNNRSQLHKVGLFIWKNKNNHIRKLKSKLG